MPKLRWVDDDKARNAVSNVVMKILREDKSLSYGDPQSGNILVHGDNLEALKALLPFYAGRVKCIYIDPPYNTGNIFPNYDDNLEHSIWLNIMYPRLILLEKFLSFDGVILVQIDKNESAYLKVIMDEIFGRQNYITTIAVRMSATSGFKIEHSDKTIVKNAEYIHVYSRQLTLRPMYESARYDSHYSYILKDAPDGLYVIEQLCDQRVVSDELEKYSLNKTAKSLPKLYEISDKFRDYVSDNRRVIGRTHTAPADALKDKNRIMSALPSDKHVCSFEANNGDKYFLKKTSTTLNQYIPISLKFQMVDSYSGYKEEMSNILGDWWGDFYYDMGNVENEGDVVFNASKKPERLIFRILNMFTNPGDIVLDAFLGSGTTCAVAMKMGRRCIGIEMGEHAKTHCCVRMKNVIGGERDGISEFVNWQGGGRFKFYELGEPLLDENGAISEGIDFDTLAAHIWWRETEKSWDVATRNGTFLGVHDGIAYAMLYNGVLHDRSYAGGNVLTPKTMRIIREDIGEAKYDRLIVYGECTKLSAAKLKEEKVEFRQTPYDIVTRR